jgi:putative membrane protein
MEEISKEKTIDSKYIQQHLANERTFLAWIRTCITLIGVGFLITNLHFSTLSEKIKLGDMLAKIIGLASIIVGILTLLIATFSYFKKGKDINQQSFHYSKFLVYFLSVALILIIIVFCFYYLFVWGMLKT